ncbi:hypothetical protein METBISCDRAFT_23262 [Metschnikowia bicuspidata]|uniref:Abscisic acid G-protein coupled receptor-like domain-containing protein n=1 Tax=Metschnikowia bicuspidata TaxID=27322 RepID=A0A4P9ZEY7_9ASCO|nr:hypothetical protein METBISCDRAFT_23262 [Metschnikowia bicuspidata]
MSLATFFVEILPFLVVFIVVYLGAYKFIFNHKLIRNYNHNTTLTPLDTNFLIAECNEKLGLALVGIDVEVDGGEPAGPYEHKNPGRKSTTDRAVCAVFASCTALSIVLVLVMLAQLTKAVRVNLGFVLLLVKVLVVTVALVQPFLVISLYINARLFPHPLSVFRTVLTVALWLVWFFALDHFGSIAASLGNGAPKSFLEVKTNDIVLMGVFITALLSGIGCALTPMRRLWLRRSNLIQKSEQGTFRALKDLTQSYNTTAMLEAKRRRELEALQRLSPGPGSFGTLASYLGLLKLSGARLFHKVRWATSLALLAGSVSEECELTQEIASLHKLKLQVHAELCQKLKTILRTRKAPNLPLVAVASRVFEDAFAVYCVYRIFRVLWFRTGSGAPLTEYDDLTEHTRDALAITLAKLVQSLFGYFPISESQLVNQISFLLSGLLFACSFQNVMITLKTLGRFLPSNTSLSNEQVRGWLKHLIVSQLLGVYLIATALLIRSNLPLDAAQLMLRVLSLSSSGSSETLEAISAEVDYVDAWFDRVFGFTSVATLAVLAFKAYFERDGAFDETFDEEMMIEEQGRAKAI